MRRFASLFLLLLVVPALRADSLASARATVEKIRQRQFKAPVTMKTITRAELRPFLVKNISKSVGTPAEYQRILETMQLVDRDPKLIEKLLDLFDSQVLAFYDPESHTYYGFDKMPEVAAGLPGMEEMIHVHELVHALQDQHFEIGARMDALQLDFDRGHAYQALVEGEASLVMFAALVQALGQTLDDLVANEAMMEAMSKAAAAAPGMENAPRYFVESLIFPYIDGFKFVAAAYRQGGWAAVDKLHQNPPISTEEILHPEQYFERVAVTSAAKIEGVGSLADGTFKTDVGEFLWRFLVGEEAGKGSAGGTFTIQKSKKGSTSLVETQWDTEADAVEFVKAYERFLRERSLQPKSKRKGNAVRVAYGDDKKAIAAFVK